MGKPITRKGDKTTGHGPYKPRASTSGSGNVFVNGIAVVRNEIDTWAPHVGDKAYNGDPHPGETHNTSSASGTVFANNKGIARIGDAVEGDTIAAGSTNVFAGG